MADPNKDKSNMSGVYKTPYEQANTEVNLSVKLPLSLDNVDGYTAIKNYRDLATQNLKMLVLTSPGEKMMDPRFGVGLKSFLFEPNNVQTHGEIEARIVRQTKMYLPYLEILQVDFDGGSQDDEFNSNFLNIVVHFKIKPLDAYEVLDVSVSST